MKYLISTLFFLLVLISSFSQDLEELQYVLENSKVNTVYVSQIGDYNVAKILQERTSMESSNYISLDQSGIYHTTNIEIKGNNNGLSVQQKSLNNKDIGNTYNGKIIGNENLLNVTQIGQENKIDHTVTMEGLNMEVKQTGYKNEINLINNYTTFTPVIIEQNGHGMKIKIENNLVTPLINQGLNK